MKSCFIMRGISGSGKSTLAANIVEHLIFTQVVSADYHFIIHGLNQVKVARQWMSKNINDTECLYRPYFADVKVCTENHLEYVKKVISG